jgi:hypothetical protein
MSVWSQALTRCPIFLPGADSAALSQATETFLKTNLLRLHDISMLLFDVFI